MKTRGICLYKESYSHLQCVPTSNCVGLLSSRLVWLSALADDWFPVVTGDVVEPHSIVVEIVQNSNTELVPLPVVWLPSAGAENIIYKYFIFNILLIDSPSGVGPVDVVVRPARGPGDAASVDLPACPEIFLALPRHQPGELALLPGAVDADWSHPVSPAEVLSLALSEASAAQPPADQEVLTSKLMVGTVTSTTVATSTASTSWTAAASSVPSEPVEKVAEEAKLRRGRTEGEETEDEEQLHPAELLLMFFFLLVMLLVRSLAGVAGTSLLTGQHQPPLFIHNCLVLCTQETPLPSSSCGSVILSNNSALCTPHLTAVKLSAKCSLKLRQSNYKICKLYFACTPPSIVILDCHSLKAPEDYKIQWCLKL